MSTTIDPSKLKVTELREELQARGLDTKGNKPVLVKRLKKALEEELSKELPDTSIADTSTEDLDSSCVEDAKGVDTGAPDRKESIDSRTSQEQESEADQSVNNDELDEPISSVDVTEPSESVTKKDDTIIESEREVHDKVQENDIAEDKKDEEKATQDVDMSEASGEIQNEPKGEKRKRSDGSPENVQKRRERSPVKEDEPEIDPEKVLLSWYDSDLHLLVNRESFLSAKPIHEGLFGYAWAGVRATHGISSGKVRYEVKITEEMKWEDFTNQRRERQEKAKERREKQQSKFKKTDVANESGDKLEEEKPKDEVSEQKSEIKKDQSEQPDEVEKMEVCEKDSSKATEELVKPKIEESQDEKSETGVKIKQEVKEESSENKTEETETTDEKAESTDQKAEPTDQEAESIDQKELCDQKTESSDQKAESAHLIADGENANELKPQEPILTHIFRTGWSIAKSSLQLGEDNCSFGYESTGKFVANKEFEDFAAPYKLGDVIGAFLNITTENIEMRYTVNGELQPEVKSIPLSDLGEENLVLFPHILSRNLAFELNLGAKEVPWFACPEDLGDYPFLQTLDEKVPGPTRPEKREECEVLMMCGLPGSGKTHWVKEYLETNTDKKITVIGCSHLLDKMTVHGKPLKSSYNGRWNILLDKLQRCLNRLSEIAPQRRRNYIIDQTNVFPSAQRRKLRDFEGFKRRAVVVVVGDEEHAKRQSLKEAQDGNDVPDIAILEMKANMAIPTKGDMLDEIIFPDLNEEEARAQVTKYNTEGKAAGFQPGQRKAGFRDDRNRWNYKRTDYSRGGFRDRGFHRFDRGPRGWGPPPPGRFQNNRRPLPPPMAGGRDWLRNNRGHPRPIGDRNGRDNRPPVNFRNPRQSGPPGGGRSGNWQAGGGNYNQGNWGQQQGNWGANSNQGWGSGYQQQGNWNTNQWKYGSNNQQQGGGGYGQQQQGYGQNWNNYYGQQYAQNWTGQGQQGATGSNQYNNQYAQWAHYAQQYAQGQNAKHANAVQAAKK